MNQHFHEIVTIADDQTWIWGFVQASLNRHKRTSVRLPSDVPIRPSWNRFKHSEPMIIHWENKLRSGGAIVEELLDIAPNFNVGEKIIVITTNPTHEDVVYFSELGIRRIIRLRHRDKDLEKSALEFDVHFRACSTENPDTSKGEGAWRALLHRIDTIPKEISEEALATLEAELERVNAVNPPTARYLDAYAALAAARGRGDRAISMWQEALEKNPNYFRAYNSLIGYYRAVGRNREALALMQKMHELNRSNVSRLVGMGEVLLNLDDDKKAEHYFKVALDRDSYCSGALNGLAEIRFKQGDLEESRRLLSQSHLAYKAAAKLNKYGIELVRKNRYGEALEHYTKAQFVLPQQDKGPLLFYNIGLCYARWGKHQIAKEFLTLALVKEPHYKKARALLDQIDLIGSGGKAAGPKTNPGAA